MTHRVVYMGTPDFASPALKALAHVDGINVPLVVTRPDRPTGRGRKMQSPPVKVVADALGPMCDKCRKAMDRTIRAD